MNKNLLDDLAGKLADVVPENLAPESLAEGIDDARSELRSNFHAVLQGALDRAYPLLEFHPLAGRIQSFFMGYQYL